MTSIRAQTAHLLLDRISPDEQIRLVRDVAKSLDINSGKSDLSFAATLLLLRPDEEATKRILDHVQDLVERGLLDQVASICLEHPEIGKAVLSRACHSIQEWANILCDESKEHFSVPVSGVAAQDTLLLDAQQVTEIVQRTTHSLRLVNRVSSHDGSADRLGALFRPTLVLLGAANHDLRSQAQEVMFLLLSGRDNLPSEDQQNIWNRVQDLTRSPDKFYQALGYSLWLRWISSSSAIEAIILKSQGYWSSIINGLRFGDSERCKSSLQILRASVDVAARDPDLLDTIAAPSHTKECKSPDPQVRRLAYTCKFIARQDVTDMFAAAVQKHYARYCTAYETIVLGRYLNQVQECEADLDFLSSDKSAVKPIWLYTLLRCALDQKMQDSNRKLIGAWVMHAVPRVDGTDEYLSFLQEAFFPWATLGYLFTNTLRRNNGVLYCEHGNNLSSFVFTLLTNYPHLLGPAVDTILASISGRHGNRFAQAKVYLIDGIARALKENPTLALDGTHLEKIYEIATWANLTEVARDYMFAQSWKMCHDHISKHTSVTSTDFVHVSAKKWETLKKKAQSLGLNASAEHDGTIGSMALPPSNREKNEQITQQRCMAFLKLVESGNTSALQADAVEEELNEIWSDLEYLEYPKGLTTSMAKIFLDHDLLQFTLQAASSSLSELISTKVEQLLQLSGPRSYLLSSLVESVRAVVMRLPESATPLRLSALIVHVAQNPPSTSIDMQLDEALVRLMPGISPELGKFSHEFYFGQREAIGFAGLLDLASRLHGIDAKLPRETFDALFEPWLHQMIPPKVVSPWKTSLELQVMLLCCEQFVPGAASDAVRPLLTDIQFVLSVEPLPRYRYLLEWMVARIYIHHPELRNVIFKELRTKDHHANPKFLASLMKIGVRIAKSEGADEAFALHLATLFVPLAASAKVVIRHEAQWQVPILLDHVRQMQIDAITTNAAFDALDEFIRSLERFDDPPLERQIGHFDPIREHNLTHLVEGQWHDLDEHEKRFCSRGDFMTLYANDDAYRSLPSSCIPLGDATLTRTVAYNQQLQPAIDHELRTLQNIDNISRALGSGAVSATALQTKGAAYLESARKRHDSLFVVASLVDNPYNLGGLSRVSEIFGAGGLYLEHPRVTSNKDFTSTAVSSHLHLAINALAPADVQAFLAKKKREEGFSVVGIEQTDRSAMLGSEECVLPEKCILVMGSEREGIPALILSECDLLVEIPQIGITRSLNVQTAAAIVLCEYAKQHNSKLK